jgi:hypothetical protein
MTKIETKNKYIEKKMNLFFFKSLRVSFSERRATANVKTNANMILSGEKYRLHFSRKLSLQKQNFLFTTVRFYAIMHW